MVIESYVGSKESNNRLPEFLEQFIEDDKKLRLNALQMNFAPRDEDYGHAKSIKKSDVVDFDHS